MQFNNETERMAHPQAGLIPASLWHDDRFFNNELDDALLPYMQADDADLHHLLGQTTVFITGTLNFYKCAWLAIAISHPNLSNETLFTLAGRWLDRNDLFKSAICWGEERFFKYLLTQYETTTLQEIIATNNRAAFNLAVGNGHLHMVNHLMKLSYINIQATIAACDYESFRNAASYGHLRVINSLVALLSDDVVHEMDAVHEMIAACNYEAFRKAASNGHLAVVKRLVKLLPNNAEAMIAACNYKAFRDAAINGHLDMVNLLVKLSPGNAEAMIAARNYEAFREAAGKGHLGVVNFLVELSSDEVVHAMIAANEYEAFNRAACLGHLDMVNRLVVIHHDHLNAINRVINRLRGNYTWTMIISDHHKAFRSAAFHCDLALLNRLVELSPSRRKIQTMIAEYNYEAFRDAARKGHLGVIKRLVELSSSRREIQAMIAARNYEAFRVAADNGHLHVVNRLLSFPSVLAYAEMHEREYGERYVHPFINNKLEELRKEIAVARSQSVKFDILDPEEAKLCFYLIRNLIRRNEPALLDNIRLLLDIPAVRALAHKEVTPGMPNELLRLAMSTGNWAAASRLLTIPAVYHLAKENNDYRDERQDSLDLAALARDCESSMPVLRVAEQLPEPKDTASNAGLASEAGFFANTSARQELEIGTTNSPRVTL